MLLAFLILSVGFVAFTNGANANFKGVASLYGSGTTSLKTALWWGTLTTLAGSVAAVFLAEGLLKKFSGKGLVSDELLQSTTFTSAVAAGAALTSFLATRLGFPVSTTHALVGALVGAGLAGGGDQVHLSALGRTFFIHCSLAHLLRFSSCRCLLGTSFSSLGPRSTKSVSRYRALRIGWSSELCTRVKRYSQNGSIASDCAKFSD